MSKSELERLNAEAACLKLKRLHAEDERLKLERLHAEDECLKVEIEAFEVRSEYLGYLLKESEEMSPVIRSEIMDTFFIEFFKFRKKVAEFELDIWRNKVTDKPGLRNAVQNRLAEIEPCYLALKQVLEMYGKVMP